MCIQDTWGQTEELSEDLPRQPGAEYQKENFHVMALGLDELNVVHALTSEFITVGNFDVDLVR